MIPKLRSKFDHFVWGDGLEKHGMAGRIAATLLRYGYGLIRDMVSGQITLRAMSLVYTTLLSVVPLIAFSFSVLQGFGIHNQLEPFLYDFLLPLGEQGAEITTQVIQLVDNVKGGVLGGISLAFFIYTAISMVQKMEESFNYVWYVVKPRSLAKRLTEYMIVMLIGPVVIVIALSMIASLRSNTIVQFFLTNEAIGPILVATNRLTPYLLVTGVFTFLYMFMPNTKVKFKAAIIGGLVGGFIWATLGVAFATFVGLSTRTQLIYSGFAVAILTLIWLYLNWLVLLFGAQLAYYIQNPAFLRIGPSRTTTIECNEREAGSQHHASRRARVSGFQCVDNGRRNQRQDAYPVHHDRPGVAGARGRGPACRYRQGRTAARQGHGVDTPG